jgi:hypothetical protein
MLAEHIQMSAQENKAKETITGSLKLHPPMDRKTLSATLFFFKAVVRAQSAASPGDISMIVKELDIRAKAKLTVRSW